MFLVAAELSKLGFIVSPTSRSAAGADLLVTDQRCSRAFTVQVKTNAKSTGNWLIGKHAEALVSRNHVYVLVNLSGTNDVEYVVVPSRAIRGAVIVKARGKARTKWYWVNRKDLSDYRSKWSAFGKP